VVVEDIHHPPFVDSAVAASVDARPLLHDHHPPVMCMAVYIAADAPLPLIPWDETRRTFHVSELSKEDEPVRVQFSKPYVVYAGSHEGCGCGFAYGQYPEHEELEDAAACMESVSRLSGYLQDVISRVGAVEVFACWEGQQGDVPTRRRKVTPAAIGGAAFWFEEREFLTVTR
jgi:hypothetical protein